MATVVHPEGWKPARGYANGMMAQGRVLAVAGQIGWDAEQKLVSKDFVAQFVQALDNVLTVVRAGGGQPSDLVSMTVYVLDKLRYLGSTQEIGAAWRERLGRHYPAMALVEVAGLVDPGALVEIQALAVIGERQGEVG